MIYMICKTIRFEITVLDVSNLLRHVINIYIYKLYYSVHLCHITPADHSHSHPICLPFKCVLSSTLLTMHHGFKTITSQYNLRDGPNHSNPFCLPHLWSSRAPAAVVWKMAFQEQAVGREKRVSTPSV